MVVGREVAAWIADVPVVPQAGSEREQPLRDAADQPGHRVGAVALERELALDRVDDRLDPLAHATEAAESAASRPCGRGADRWRRAGFGDRATPPEIVLSAEEALSSKRRAAC